MMTKDISRPRCFGVLFTDVGECAFLLAFHFFDIFVGSFHVTCLYVDGRRYYMMCLVFQELLPRNVSVASTRQRNVRKNSDGDKDVNPPRRTSSAQDSTRKFRTARWLMRLCFWKRELRPGFCPATTSLSRIDLPLSFFLSSLFPAVPPSFPFSLPSSLRSSSCRLLKLFPFVLCSKGLLGLRRESLHAKSSLYCLAIWFSGRISEVSKGHVRNSGCPLCHATGSFHIPADLRNSSATSGMSPHVPHFSEQN